MSRLLSPRFVLPLLLFCGVLTLSLRAHDMWQALASGTIRPSAAWAETQSTATAATATTSAAATASAAAEPAKEKKPADAGTAALPAQLPTEDITPAEMKVLQQLAVRREELDKRAKELDQRSDLLKVAEQRIDEKIKEMETLRTQLQSMVDQVSGAHSAEIANLAKIYATMKPEDAATIFNTLDMPVLIGVIQSMKPKDTAPIMAKMEPKKAKELTIALTKLGDLPAGK